ncbi:MAG: tetratricopeptide repeat protein [Candidatus Omnitrophica bacterium]|nr:tetratricopeptide repeat protein [Candidatus Omnitrophota bacterium]
MNKRRVSDCRKVIFLLFGFCVLIGSSVPLAADTNKEEIKKFLAEAYAASGDYENAIKQYREILEKEPANSDIQRELAQVYIWNEQYDKAKEILKVILKNNPGDSEAKLLFAKALQYSGEAKEAIEIYKELLQEK